MTAQQTEPAPIAFEAVESAVEFRVSRPGMPRRRLRLVGPRCVFGSGPDCSVRLNDPSVRTTHAVLTRDANVVLLRAYGAPILVNGQPITEHPLDLGDHFQLGPYEFELVGAFPPLEGPASPADAGAEASTPPPADGRSSEPRASDPPRSPAERGDVVAETSGAATGRSTERRQRVAFADSMRIVGESATARTAAALEEKEGPGVAAPLEARGAGGIQEVIDHLALLAGERRHEERNKRQIARYRRREERQRKQIQALRAAQESAEQRARRAEESVHDVRAELDALADRVAVIAKTAMPDIEDRLQQQHQEALVASRQYHELIAALRQRLDAVQDAVDAVQGETREIRQQTASVREDQQEVLAGAEQLEQMIQLLSDSREEDRAGQAGELDEMRETLRQMSLKLTHTSSELDETRQSSQGLSSLVQQLRASLLNMQNDHQRFATIERIDSVERQMRATELRLNELCQEYDAQTLQLQQECESLRERLEDVEDVEDAATPLAAAAAPSPSQPIPPDVVASDAPADAGDEIAPTTAEQTPLSEWNTEPSENDESSEEPVEWGSTMPFSQFPNDDRGTSEEPPALEPTAVDPEGLGEQDEVAEDEPRWQTQHYDPADAASEPELTTQDDSRQAWEPEQAYEPEQEGLDQTYRLDPTGESQWEQDDHCDLERSDSQPGESEAPGTQAGGLGTEDGSQPFGSSPTGGRSAAEILSSMGLSYDDGDEAAGDDLPPVSDSFASEEPMQQSEEPAAAVEAAEGEDDDSIEAYMNRLLKRVQGGSGSASVAAPSGSRPITHTVEPKRERQTAPVEAPAITVGEPSHAVEKTPYEDTPYVPRSQAPERNNGLSAMRELANDSARLAIAHSVRQRMVHEKMFKFSLFGMGLVAGFSALIGSGFEMDRWFIVACCCFGLSIFFLVEGLSLARRLRQADAAPAS